ncbi:MAG TPA: hypothetical protein PLC40_04105, partial [Candidatus Hydrogenedentes bacterium]|nr:hypothetical protein [Candidatus Hydrogenedentota bacterium]
RSGILPLCIKTDIRAAVTIEAAGCRFYDLRCSLRADLGNALSLEILFLFLHWSGRCIPVHD